MLSLAKSQPDVVRFVRVSGDYVSDIDNVNFLHSDLLDDVPSIRRRRNVRTFMMARVQRSRYGQDVGARVGSDKQS